MTPSESIAALFDSMDITTVCLWTTGFILFSVEFFRSMHGVMYAIGASLIGAAFVNCMMHGSPGEAFTYIFSTAVLLFAVHVVSLATQKRDWLYVSRMERTGERRRKFGSLIGSIGVAGTPINLTGNAAIDDVNLVVYSETPIAQGEKVKIVKVTTDKIIVERVEND